MRTAHRFAFPMLAAIVMTLSACGGSGAPSSNVPEGVSAQNDVHSSVPMSQRIVLSPTDTLLAQPLPRSVAAASGAPPVMNAFVSISPNVSGVPCFNCVGNPPIAKAYGIPYAEPYAALVALAEETYAFEDLSVTATCTIVFKIEQNSTTLATYKFTNISIQPNFVYLYAHASALPATAVAGPAKITGNVVCPVPTTTAATENVYFH